MARPASGNERKRRQQRPPDNPGERDRHCGQSRAQRLEGRRGRIVRLHSHNTRRREQPYGRSLGRAYPHWDETGGKAGRQGTPVRPREDRIHNHHSRSLCGRRSRRIVACGICPEARGALRDKLRPGRAGHTRRRRRGQAGPLRLLPAGGETDRIGNAERHRSRRPFRCRDHRGHAAVRPAQHLARFQAALARRRPGTLYLARHNKGRNSHDALPSRRPARKAQQPRTGGTDTQGHPFPRRRARSVRPHDTRLRPEIQDRLGTHRGGRLHERAPHPRPHAPPPERPYGQVRDNVHHRNLRLQLQRSLHNAHVQAHNGDAARDA